MFNACSPTPIFIVAHRFPVTKLTKIVDFFDIYWHIMHQPAVFPVPDVKTVLVPAGHWFPLC